MCLEVYKQEMFSASFSSRVLHFAPEKCFLEFFSKFNYVPADANPDIYPWAKLLKLFLPDDFKIFPDGYFQYIIHNHVLEHIPGNWKAHIAELIRCLDVNGKMIFSVPGPINPNSVTLDGGELLGSDEERLKLFGQRDHFKKFGSDLFEFISGLDNIKFVEAVSIPAEVATKYNAGERLMVAQKL